ncbi:Receptor protein kinase CLAVATA1 precursor, putative [Ricinus communis]|uniref:non-specific serine/threonine protein kinase n=1 Tax=Ricinus communis TaxID=3988 RepID=B9S7S2_RICCO|nr:Receptor protein kinase CLAVATA1 precursor, putative [Ricinus communis]|eukprot:XP_002522038.1 receptor-like protein kinase HAIKU2 [Ricinus communis]
MAGMSDPQFFRQCYSSMLSFLVFLMLVSPSKSDDLQMLLNFKSSLKDSETNVFSSWTEQSSVCKFTGIVCTADGFVKEISLPEKKLQGVVPFGSICALQYLEKISLGSNFLRGVITDDLRNCRNLQVLDLGNNFFSGQVPDLSSLHKLRILNLNGSGFSGSFPWKSLENLTNLEFLSLGDNRFDATSSFPAEVIKFNKLYWLYLTNCSIKGKIPEGISNLTLLENLELSDNELFGEIPEGIGKLSKLWQLEIYNNALSGKLPAGLGNLTNLVNFDASTNKLEGEIGVLISLKKLASLQLFENQFSGEIPAEFGEFKYLSEFSLYRNKFTGSLPEKLGSWSDFGYIDVSENFLTGPIPPDMCKNGKMTDLLILQNKFTGQVPESYANCKSLNRLRVNNNSLSGTVPAGIWGLPNLTIIDLTMNQFEGPLTADIGYAKSLGSLALDNNQFSGELPAAISSASSLVSIQLSSNQFTGRIPENIGELKKLNRLHLDGNLFFGTIPDSLGSCVSLDDINLSGNSISGEIPETLGSLPTLNSLNLSSNKLSGQIPVSLSSLRLSNLDLSNNQLVGPIPNSLSLGVFREGFNGNPGLCSNTLWNIRPCSSTARNSSHLRVLLSCFAAGLLVLVISAGYLLYLKSKPNNLNHPLKRSSWDMKSFRVLSFSERDIIDSIKSENLIGKGGSGNVYKVLLRNGNELAVKHIWTSHSSDRKSCQSSSAMLTKRNFRSLEYDAEVAALSTVRHVNVVKLFCSITSEDSNLLVYEYLPNGSLWDQLHSCNKIQIGWELRYAIALGAARGLEYLHHGFDRPVIHRDVKSSNILLDEDWKPRIADFGLAKIVQGGGGGGGGGEWSNMIAGTYGYMAPEYAYTCKVNEKSDVYSFGVVLMELVTGKRPTEPEFGENKDIVYWVHSKISRKENSLDIVDSNISERLKEDAIKVLQIAVHCTAKIPALRPTMRLVVQMLEEAESHQLSDIIVVKKEGGSSPDEKLKTSTMSDLGT